MFTVKPPKIKTRTVSVPVKPAPTPASNPPPAQKGNEARRSPAGPPSNRFSLTPANKARTSSSTLHPENARRTYTATSRTQKKRKVSPNIQQWASSDESSDESDYPLSGRKRQKTSSSIEPMSLNRCLPPDQNRRIRIYEKNGELANPDAEKAAQRAVEAARLIPAVEMTQGKYRPAFKSNPEKFIVELQYPSPARPERFETVVPHDAEDFNPLDDIYFSIEEIIQHYLPASVVEAQKLDDEAEGTVRLLKRAVTKDSPSDFKSTLAQFNAIVKDNLDGIAKVIDEKQAIPLSLVKRITAQVYQRTVSYRSKYLRRVKAKAKETTYGELLPSFAHTIFQQTGLNSTSVFVDLGSGVGNVVLQSALQTGAESWGIEIMQTPAEYALDQASELRARAKLWNISLGPIKLFHGDFLESPEMDKVLRRADVVLVNNKVFPEKLNGALLDKFLDLKDGCKVVSLQSFGGGAGKQGIRNENSIANLFDEERYDSGTNSVSWASESVEYFIATKAR